MLALQVLQRMRATRVTDLLMRRKDASLTSDLLVLVQYCNRSETLFYYCNRNLCNGEDRAAGDVYNCTRRFLYSFCDVFYSLKPSVTICS